MRDAMLDEGSFRSWDTPPHRVDASEAYRRELAAASAATGLEESVVTGEGTVFGRRVALVACEFDFLAGSIGVAAAERITNAVERATAERLPLLASPSSGGTRMQEGTVAFLQMVKIAELRHRQGFIDGVVPPEAVRSTLDRTLKVVADPPEAPPAVPEAEPFPDVPAWESVEASRRPDRPGVGYLLRHGT